MKKVLYILAIAAITLLSSCQKDPIGGTAVQDMSGQWYVQVDLIDDAGEVVIEDFNEGRIILLTYNTSSNRSDSLYVNDLGDFWDFKAKVPCSLANKSFGTDELTLNESYASGVYLYNGKIVPNGATTPSGQPADYIEFLIEFDDDDLASYGMPGVSWLEYYDAAAYRVSGWRYTGFTEDD